MWYEENIMTTALSRVGCKILDFNPKGGLASTKSQRRSVNIIFFSDLISFVQVSNFSVVLDG